MSVEEKTLTSPKLVSPEPELAPAPQLSAQAQETAVAQNTKKAVLSCKTKSKQALPQFPMPEELSVPDPLAPGHANAEQEHLAMAQLWLRLDHDMGAFFRFVSALTKVRASDGLDVLLCCIIFGFLMSNALFEGTRFLHAHELAHLFRVVFGFLHLQLLGSDEYVLDQMRFLSFTLIPFASTLTAIHYTIRRLKPPARTLKGSTHIGLSDAGIQLIASHPSSRHKRFHSWATVRGISIEENKTRHRRLLSIRFNQARPIKISLGSFSNRTEQQVLFSVLRKKLNDPGLLEQLDRAEQLLEAAPEKTYTELWSQSLLSSEERLRESLLPPDTVLCAGRFRIVKQLGSGAQGTAYLAEDQSELEFVVLKEYILPDQGSVADRRRALSTLEEESALLSRLQHPQVVKAMDIFVEDHRAYLVLEHVNGPSLKGIVLQQGQLEEKEVVKLGLQMCDVLIYLHQLAPPMVHQDFTPDNLLLDSQHSLLKLVDFNLAKERQNSKTALVVGKHAYMPPEQFRGKVCPQNDIYALGATLFFLLTGEEPEPLSSSHPAEHNGAISGELNAIVARATALDLADRFQTAVDLRIQLEKLTHQNPVTDPVTDPATDAVTVPLPVNGAG